MTTKLLARKNGDIAIVQIVDTKQKFLVLMYACETQTFKVFLAEQGRVWELFLNVDDATKWIHKQNKEMQS